MMPALRAALELAPDVTEELRDFLLPRLFRVLRVPLVGLATLQRVIQHAHHVGRRVGRGADRALRSARSGGRSRSSRLCRCHVVAPSALAAVNVKARCAYDIACVQRTAPPGRTVRETTSCGNRVTATFVPIGTQLCLETRIVRGNGRGMRVAWRRRPNRCAKAPERSWNRSLNPSTSKSS